MPYGICILIFTFPFSPLTPDQPASTMGRTPRGQTPKFTNSMPYLLLVGFKRGSFANDPVDKATFCRKSLLLQQSS
ncbi:MAG TPA: hypothetical protein VMX13_10020, partial [Sedimentisphaerales bacterium]|nr:hypothetical protein [Sedimentisphaerales bacterium]